MFKFFFIFMFENAPFHKEIIINNKSTPRFNILSKIQGDYNRNIKYIEQKTNSKISVYITADDEHIKYIITAPTEEELNAAEKLSNDLIITVQKQSEKDEYLTKVKDKKKKNKKSYDFLPDQTIMLMRTYYPGIFDDASPPGSHLDNEIHTRKYRVIAKEQKWLE